MRVVEIGSLDDPALTDYTALTDVQLRRVREPAEGLFLAESVKVIARAIAAGHTPRSALLIREWLPTLEPVLEAHPDLTVFVGDAEQLQGITGFHLHRGALAAFHRPQARDPLHLLQTSRRVVVLEDLADHTNVGAVFRSVAALGADAVLLTPGCADPLYRRAVRVSMAAVLQVPWARLPAWREAGPLIRNAGYELTAFTLDDDAHDLADYAQRIPDRLAMMFGTEGAGLSQQALASSTAKVMIPMDGGIDSLNVATSAAVALWAVRTADRARAQEHLGGVA